MKLKLKTDSTFSPKQLPLFKEVIDNNKERGMQETFYVILLQEAILRDQSEFIDVLINKDNANIRVHFETQV